MKKNAFLQEIKNGLFLFEESYQQKIILEMDELFEESLKSGLTEEEALLKLGSSSSIINSILKRNHVNSQFIKRKSFLKEKLEKLFSGISHVVEVMGKNSFQSNAKIIFDIILLIVLTCLLKIPFILIRDLGINFLEFLSNPFLIGIWQFVIEILYLVVGIFFFFIVFEKWFRNLKIKK